MSTPQPPAATRAPAHDARASARATQAPAEEPVAGESRYARVKRSFQSAVSAVLDAGIALLQSLRKRVGGAQDAGREAGEDRPGSGRARQGGRRDAVAPPSEAEVQASKPKRRLLAYLCVLLAGGMGGGVLAYELLDRGFAESERPEAMISKHSGAIDTAGKNSEEEQAERVDAQKTLEEAQAGRVEAEKKGEEAQAGRIDAEKKAEEAQAGRVDAEKKFEASRAEYAKSAAEKQKTLDATEKRLETMLAAGRASNVPRPSPVSHRDAVRKPAPLKTGSCDLNSGNIAALKGCIEDFNR